jgi:hypothetical protein
VRSDQRLAREIEHQIELFLPLGLGPGEVDGPHGTACRDAVAMRLALGQIDLVAEADRPLGAGAHAGVAARAELEVDRILLPPLDVEGAEPAGELHRAPRPHREAALDGQLAAGLGDEHAHRKLAREPLGPVERRGGRTDDQQLARRLVLRGRRRLGVGQRGRGDERRHLRRRGFRFGRPAGKLAHVHELHSRRGSGAFGKLVEERRFLRAGDQHVALAERRLEGGRVAAAELLMHDERLGDMQRAGKRLGVERDGAVAAADLKCLALEAHPAALPLLGFPEPARLLSLPGLFARPAS